MFSSLILCLLASYCFSQGRAWKAEVTYTVNSRDTVKNDPTNDYLKISNFEGVQAQTTFRKMIVQLFSSARSGETPIFQVDGYRGYEKLYPLLPKELERIMNSSDTLMEEDFETGELVVKVTKQNILVDDIIGIHLHQDWFYNQKDNKIEVEITDVELLALKADPYRRGVIVPLCTFKYKKRAGTEGGESQRAYASEITWSGAIPLSILEDSSKAAEEQALLTRSTRGSGLMMQHKLMFDQTIEQYIFQKVLAGEMVAYKTSELKEVLSSTEITDLVTSIDTSLEEDFETGELVIVLIENKIVEEGILALRVNQIIEFDAKTTIFKSRIVSAAIIYETWDRHWNPIIEEALFWVKF